ncbi:MAG: hypothetical protein M3A44_12190 [Gammaproteobacteria bacterium]
MHQCSADPSALITGKSSLQNAQIDGLTLTQTAGATCAPVITRPTAFPLGVGAIPGSGTVTIDFTSCANTARFSALTGVGLRSLTRRFPWQAPKNYLMATRALFEAATAIKTPFSKGLFLITLVGGLLLSPGWAEAGHHHPGECGQRRGAEKRQKTRKKEKTRTPIIYFEPLALCDSRFVMR